MRKSTKLIFIVVMMIFILGLGIDLYSPSFPAIREAFGTTEQLVQLTISYYFLGYVAGLLVLGPLSDAIGRRRPLIWGLLFYIAMSLLCSFSTSIDKLLLFRVLQGFGVSIVGISFRSIFSDVFTGKDLAKAMAYSSMSYRVGPIIAPLIGGYLQVYFGWQSNFYFLAAYALLVVCLIVFYLPETHLETIPFEPKTLLRRKLNVLKNRVFVGGALLVGIQYAMLLIFNIVGPFFIQDILGYSPIQYGHIAFFVGVFAFAGILLNRFLLQKVSHLRMIQIGQYAVVGVCVLFAIFARIYPVDLWTFIVPVFLVLFFSGFIVSNTLSHAMNLIPRGKGLASGLQGILLIAVSVTFTTLSSFLKTETVIPFAYTYLAMSLLCFLIYQTLFKEV